MHVRRLLALAVALPLVGALPADAAPKKPPRAGCAFTDPRGDASVFSDGSLDLTGGDLAVRSRELVAVLRVAGTEVGVPGAPAEWRLGLSGNGIRYDFIRRVGSDGGQRTEVSVGGQPVAHKFTLVGTTLTWRFERRLAPLLSKPKIVWHDWAAATSVAGVPVDNATSTKCVR